MPIISNSVFEGYADRLAFQAKQISDAIDAAKLVGTGLFYTRITGTNDFDVENPLILPSNNLDNNMANFSGTEKTLLSNTFSSAISALITHVNTVGSSSNITTLDSFLTTSGIQVSHHFEDAFFASQGTHLDAINTFGPQLRLSTYAATGSGTGAFSDIQALGTGSGKRTEVPANYGADSFEVITQTVIGGTDLVLDVQVTDEAGASDSKQVTVTSGTASGVGFDVGVPGTDTYIDVTNIVAAGGTSGDSIVVVNKEQRGIAL